MFKFETLNVWKKSVTFANLMIDVGDGLQQKYQYSFGDQLRRAGLSVSNNIAEGSGRKGKKESNHLYNIAKGSVYECVNIITILDMREMVDWKKYNKKDIYNLAEEISRMLSGLMKV